MLRLAWVRARLLDGAGDAVGEGSAVGAELRQR